MAEKSIPLDEIRADEIPADEVPAGPVPAWADEGDARTLPTWDGALYAANTGHHRRHDETFLASLPLQPADYVLDLGCGAGDLTVQVAALVSSGHVVGVDPQASLLAEAAARARPNQSFVQGAAQDLGRLLPGESRFDVVLSQSVLHWIPAADHPAVLAEVHRLVRPGGWFRAEFGGAGNVPAVLALLDAVSAPLGGPTTPWFFSDAGWYLEQLERSGFDVAAGFVRTNAQRRGFTRAELEGWFLSQCVQAYDAGLPDDTARAAFRQQVAARFDDLARWDGTFDQTFVRLDVLARRG
jgi:ubiquinone/menaquinone biosynthesis C-methylase UbiE